MGNVKSHTETIFHMPLRVGARLAFAKPTNDATNMCDPDNGIPNIVPKNKMTAIGIWAAKAVLGCNSVIVPTLFITPRPSITRPLARLNPVINNSILRSTAIPTPITIPTAFEQSLPALEKAVQQMTANNMYEKNFSDLS